MSTFNLVATGGTFDVIHVGHISLLSKAFQISKRTIIGITSDSFVKRMKGKNKIGHRYEERVSNIKKTIKEVFGSDAVFDIVQLDTKYGPTVIFGEVEALVTSTETAKIGQEINQIRLKLGLKQLAIVVVEILKSEDGKPISSTRIRAGEIDASGNLLNNN